jgi:pantothenate kinase
MDLIKVFPEKVIDTDQVLDVTEFSSQWKEEVLRLADRILEEYTKNNKPRFIVALGGASGSSKSLTAKVLEEILNKSQSDVRVITVGQDGYHFPQKHLLETHDENDEQLAAHKGRYDSYDVVSMKNDLNAFVEGKEVSFPLYSRKIHDPIENALQCTEQSCILIFEGLWLLYDAKPWNELLPIYNLTVFIHAPADIRKRNTIERHVRGNERSPQEAEIFYDQSDAKNADLIVNSISKHDFDFEYSA